MQQWIVTLEKDEDGWYIVECPAIPGCVSQGRTEKEALENIKDAIVECLEVRAEEGLPSPSPSVEGKQTNALFPNPDERGIETRVVEVAA